MQGPDCLNKVQTQNFWAIPFSNINIDDIALPVIREKTASVLMGLIHNTGEQNECVCKSLMKPSVHSCIETNSDLCKIYAEILMLIIGFVQIFFHTSRRCNTYTQCFPCCSLLPGSSWPLLAVLIRLLPRPSLFRLTHIIAIGFQWPSLYVWGCFTADINQFTLTETICGHYCWRGFEKAAEGEASIKDD